MIQLPYREHESLSGGGEIEATSNYMEVMTPGRVAPREGTVTTATGTYTTVMKPKRNSKSYKTELKNMTKERDKWRKACKWCVICFLGYIAIDILYAIFG